MLSRTMLIKKAAQQQIPTSPETVTVSNCCTVISVIRTYQFSKLDNDLAHAVVEMKMGARSLLLQCRDYICVWTRLPFV